MPVNSSWLFTGDQKSCNSREYTSALSAIFNSQNKRKVDAELPPTRDEQNWYTELSLHSNPA